MSVTDATPPFPDEQNPEGHQDTEDRELAWSGKSRARRTGVVGMSPYTMKQSPFTVEPDLLSDITEYSFDESSEGETSSSVRTDNP